MPRLSSIPLPFVLMACGTANQAPRPCAASSSDTAPAREPPPAPSSGPLRELGFLLGVWEGDEDTSIGRGRGVRVTRMVLGGTYLNSQNRSEFAPTDQRPKGDVHEDWELWSYDIAAKRFVIRQFNSEGYVNHFVQKPSDDPKRLVFETVASENAPPGLRAQLSYERLSSDELLEIFEIYWPARDTPTVFRNHWRRSSSKPP